MRLPQMRGAKMPTEKQLAEILAYNGEHYPVVMGKLQWGMETLKIAPGVFIQVAPEMMTKRLTDETAARVEAILDKALTCDTCGQVGKSCQCK